MGSFAEGVPVHDTIARLIARIEPTQLQRCFANWMQAVAVLTDGQVVAIDGKTLCSSYHRTSRRSIIHMVSAFASANGVVLGQVKIEQGRGRIEYRAYHVLGNSLLPEHLSSQWFGIKTVGLAMSYRLVKQKKNELEYRYFISFAPLSASRLACEFFRQLCCLFFELNGALVRYVSTGG